MHTPSHRKRSACLQPSPFYVNAHKFWLTQSKRTNILISVAVPFNTNWGSQGLSTLTSLNNPELTLSRLNSLIVYPQNHDTKPKIQQHQVSPYVLSQVCCWMATVCISLKDQGTCKKKYECKWNYFCFYVCLFLSRAFMGCYFRYAVSFEWLENEYMNIGILSKARWIIKKKT